MGKIFTIVADCAVSKDLTVLLLWCGRFVFFQNVCWSDVALKIKLCCQWCDFFQPKGLVLWTEVRFSDFEFSGGNTLQAVTIDVVFVFFVFFLTGCDSYSEESYRGVFSCRMVASIFCSSCLVYLSWELWFHLLSVLMTILPFTAFLCYLWYGCCADTTPWLR